MPRSKVTLNGMVLNTDKTKVLLIKSRQKRLSMQNPALSLRYSDICHQHNFSCIYVSSFLSRVLFIIVDKWFVNLFKRAQ